MAKYRVYTQLPIFSDEKYRYGIALQGVSWQMTFHWNERSSQWSMDLRLEDQTAVVLGVPIVPRFPMCQDYNLADYGLDGFFLLLPISGSVVETLGDSVEVMKKSFSLFYVYDYEEEDTTSS